MIIVNHEYHGVEVANLPDIVYSWLEEHMGMSGDRWFIRHKLNGTMIYFKNKHDHMIFLLAWGK